MTDKVVKSWKSDPSDRKLLAALKKAKVERSESGRVRAGLRSLAREKGIVIP